jgi:nucleoside diphosphate kinase
MSATDATPTPLPREVTIQAQPDGHIIYLNDKGYVELAMVPSTPPPIVAWVNRIFNVVTVAAVGLPVEEAEARVLRALALDRFVVTIRSFEPTPILAGPVAPPRSAAEAAATAAADPSPANVEALRQSLMRGAPPPRSAAEAAAAALAGETPTEATFALIKPDAFAAHHEYPILRAIADAGLVVTHQKVIHISRDAAKALYAEHEHKSFFGGLVDFTNSGRSIAMVLTGPDAVARWRALMGPTSPAVARETAPKSMRALFGDVGCRNATHGSDSVESARREIALFFPDAAL